MQAVKRTWGRGVRGKFLVGCATLLAGSCLLSIPIAIFSPKSTPRSTPVSQAQVIQVTILVTQPPTVVPSPTVPPTPVPTATPEPTATPAPTETPIAPVVMEGSGSDVLDLPVLGLSIVRIQGNQGGQYFGVESFDASGEHIDLLVNTSAPYNGVRPLNFTVKVARRLQVKASGSWRIEIVPLREARRMTVPGAVEGDGDDVVIVGSSDGPKPDTATIVGNDNARYFGVFAWGDQFYDLLVNTSDPYSGKVILKAGMAVFEVRAEGPWSITVAARSG